MPSFSVTLSRFSLKAVLKSAFDEFSRQFDSFLRKSWLNFFQISFWNYEYILLKAAATDMRYFARSKFSRSLPLLSLNELGEKSQAAIILSKFVNKPKPNSYRLIAFGICFSLVEIQWEFTIFFSRIFDLLLINSSRYLLLGVYFSLYQKNAVYKYKLKRKPIMI